MQTSPEPVNPDRVQVIVMALRSLFGLMAASTQPLEFAAALEQVAYEIRCHESGGKSSEIS